MDNSKDTIDSLIDTHDDTFDSFTITLPSSNSLDSNYGAIPPDYTLGTTIISSPDTYTLTSNGTSPVWSTVSLADMNVNTKLGQSATIQLSGEDADIDINGKSMKSWMEQVEQRLNILTVNPELEKEWAELKELGDRYRELEKLCKEKADVWTKLKSMPPLDL